MSGHSRCPLSVCCSHTLLACSTVCFGLFQLFSVTMYDVVLPLPHELVALGYKNHNQLIQEMVAQRLAQNYQLVVYNEQDDAKKPRERSSAPATEKPLYSLIVGRKIHHVRAWCCASCALMLCALHTVLTVWSCGVCRRS